jgi:hypothetical protein
MHTYQLMNNRWWVIHYRRVMVILDGTSGPRPPDTFTEDKIIPMRDFGSEREAAAYCNYLNGGSVSNQP